MSVLRLTCIALALGIVVSPLLAAHHGWAEFDETAEVTMEATVVAFHFVNPHCVVEFDRKDQAGQVRRWQAEFASPRELGRKGWTAASLQPGDKVTITGHPAKDINVRAVHLTRIRMTDGREIAIETQQ
jgi:hypothetical protein